MARPPGSVSSRLWTWSPQFGSGRASRAFAHVAGLQVFDTRVTGHAYARPRGGGRT
jgi:hypothetical protein